MPEETKPAETTPPPSGMGAPNSYGHDLSAPAVIDQAPAPEPEPAKD